MLLSEQFLFDFPMVLFELATKFYR